MKSVNVGNSRGILGARRLVACQIGITLFFSVVVLCYLGTIAFKSALLGGVVSIVPGAVFAMLFFRHRGAHQARQMLLSFYKGEAIKFVLTFVMFALVLVYCRIVPWVFFMTYLMVQLTFWFAPLIFDNKQNRAESD